MTQEPQKIDLLKLPWLRNVLVWPMAGCHGGKRMSKNTSKDQLVVIRIEGMHCHNCEQNIKKVLGTEQGVHEVEVDFNSGQASVLFNRSAVPVKKLMELINQAGYRAVSFTQSSTS